MRQAGWGSQASAGAIVGLSAVIYSISYGALMFAGPLSGHVGYAITMSLITAIIGALFGCFSEEKSFISGPDSNTISVLAGSLAVMASAGATQEAGLQMALAMAFLTALFSGLGFYAVVRLNLAELVRYIPFSVMAGFLASTGWLMSSGALNIISGTPLSLAGMQALVAHPWRPELLLGIGVVVALYRLSARLSGAVLIPLVMLAAALLVNLVFASGYCAPSVCDRAAWMFGSMQEAHWLAPWQLDWNSGMLRQLLIQLPSMLVVSFVGVLTILLSIASLELSFEREFDLNRIIRAHAATTLIGAAAGGFVGIISMGRTTLNHKLGGRGAAGVVAALCCLAILCGAGGVIAYLPKAALGGLVLYLGLNMLRQWLWDQRKTASQLEMAQIVLILLLVANFGYLVGFFAGVVIACMIFVVTYSRLPLANRSTDLALFPSSVIRPQHQVELLQEHGQRALLYRLNGYVFFGSAAKIDRMFQEMDVDSLDGVVIDFSQVSGIDRSAISVFQRILRRYQRLPLDFYFVHAPANRDSLLAIARDPAAAQRLSFFASLDYALETAEDKIIMARQNEAGAESPCFAFIEDADQRAVFESYCEEWWVARGDTLFVEGAAADSVYFVESGSFDIVKALKGGASVRLAKLNKGAITGEMAFYTDELRSASIVAVSDAQVYMLTRAALARMREEQPALAARFDHMVIRKVAGALGRTNKLIAALN